MRFQTAIPVPVQTTPYHFKDPFVDILSLCHDLLKMEKYSKQPIQAWRHYGELVSGMFHLLEMTRKLEVITSAEEIKEFKVIIAYDFVSILFKVLGTCD